MKNNLTTTIILSVLLITTQAIAQKLTRQEVESKLTRSWTATQTGVPGHALITKKNKEIMNFKPDGVLVMERHSGMMGDMTIEAGWKFEEAGQKLVLTLSMDGRTEVQEIEIGRLTDDHLTLKSPRKITEYVPSENAVQQTVAEQGSQPVEAAGPAPEASDLQEGLNPEDWSGKLAYNIIIMMDESDNTVEERVSGEIKLEKSGEKRIITKTQDGTTQSWNITGDIIIANNTRYTGECSDPGLTGEITFQNGVMLLEIYKPKYMSYVYGRE